MHNKTKHEVKNKEDWNCNDCPFQANIAAELINHLKLTAHQPSQNNHDQGKSFKDYRRCYTCQLEFDGYWNLMNHRKTAHPSNKRCRNFPGGKCNFEKECWYVHEEDLMDVDESFKSDSQAGKAEHKCYIFQQEFKSMDEVKKHKKSIHPINVQVCERFLIGKCDRIEEQCWFKHKLKDSNFLPKSSGSNPLPKSNVFSQSNNLPQSSPISGSSPWSKPTANENPVFREATRDPFPPDQILKMMEAVSNLCTKVESMEKKLQELMN